MNDQAFDFDELKALQPNTFTKTGYHFTGWNTKSDGKGVSYTDQQKVFSLSAEDACGHRSLCAMGSGGLSGDL